MNALKRVEKARASRIENEGLTPTKVAHEENLEKLGANLKLIQFLQHQAQSPWMSDETYLIQTKHPLTELDGRICCNRMPL